MKKFNPLDYPISLMYPTRIASSHWTEHVPFAMTLIDMVRPSTFVELGTFAGVSYCAFCQAIAYLQLDTRAFAVDTWKGDPHNGENGPSILEDLRAFHDPLYGSFSRLVQSTFDDALPHFPDGAIDLLHIDGYHIYEAVQHDFASWLPKMSRCGVVVLHDINVREYKFGVWKLWQEIQSRYPTFDLIHEHGLGLVAVGEEVPEGLRPLLDSSDAERVAIREYYFQLGRRISAHAEKATFEGRLAESQAQHEAQLVELRAQHQAQMVESQVQHEAQLAVLHTQHQAQLTEVQAQHGALVAEIRSRHQTELQEQRARVSQIEATHAEALVREQARWTEMRSKLAEAQQLVRVGRAQLEEKNALLEILQPEVVTLRAQLADKDATLHSLTAAYRGLEGMYQHWHAEALRAQDREYNLQVALGQTQASLAWRLAHFLARCSHKVAPRGTRRRRVLGTARRAARAVRPSRVRGVLSRATARLWQLLW